jgi:hypothetical protein
MIVFDLECSAGHRFEGWFESPEAYERQRGENLLRCPSCNDPEVKRVLSAVSVKRSASDEKASTSPIDYGKLAKEMVRYLQKNFEDVGPNFAAEALKMHYGVADRRSIRGSATDEEEKSLKDEGIEFFKIPVPVDPDKEKKN